MGTYFNFKGNIWYILIKWTIFKEGISLLDIALLGTGGSMPVPGRFLSSLLISYKGRKILIACEQEPMDEPELYIQNAKEVFSNTIIGFDRFSKTLTFEK